MPRTKSVGEMLVEISGAWEEGTIELTTWESTFIPSVMQRSDHGRKTVDLSINQVDCIEKIWYKYCHRAPHS